MQSFCFITPIGCYHHCPHPSVRRRKCSFDLSILLWCVPGSIFKLDINSFLVHLLFQGLFFASIIATNELHLFFCAFKPLMKPMRNGTCAALLLRKKLHFILLVSSTTSNQYLLTRFFLLVLMELMSIMIRSPGFFDFLVNSQSMRFSFQVVFTFIGHRITYFPF